MQVSVEMGPTVNKMHVTCTRLWCRWVLLIELSCKDHQADLKQDRKGRLDIVAGKQCSPHMNEKKQRQGPPEPNHNNHPVTHKVQAASPKHTHSFLAMFGWFALPL